MSELVFDVEFLSDIVLPATSNTEGKIEQLDFIPGSNFLGMVAREREYEKFSDSFAIFHSGAVRFGDARVIVDGEATYKMPLSFFHEKLNKSQMVNHHLIEDFTKFKQLKQKRKGYITSGLKEFSIEYSYAQKSAYNKDKRRSKDSSMYGYNSIPLGTRWQFSVKCDSTVKHEDIERIKKNLLGTKRLGKSKSSQYGLVEISEATKLKSVESSFNKKETIVVYAKSRIALVDKEGTATYDLRYLLDGLKDENIIYEKSQIKTTSFTPYNGAMKTKTYERLVINSGSVIVLKNLSSEQLQALEEGVGVYLAEGFGELIVNPVFLEKEGEFKLEEACKAREDEEKITVTDPMVKFLENREKRKRETLDLSSEVSKFISANKKLYGKISNSQWGTIRSICSSPKKEFRAEIREYISDGKVTWTTEQIETLLEEAKSRAFIKLLSMQMPKVNEEK